MDANQTVEFSVQGMDCAECALHVQHAIEKVPGVTSANVLLGAEKAIVRLDGDLVDMPTLRRAAEGAGYQVPSQDAASVKHQVTSHTLVTIGVVAALAVGEWATAAVVVFFMRVGDYAEKFTAEGARRAVKELTALAPQMARVERAGAEVELPPMLAAAAQSIPDLGILANSARLLWSKIS